MTQDIDFSTAQWYRGSGEHDDPNAPIIPSYTLPDLSWFGHPFMDGLRKTAQRLPDQIAVDDGTVRLSYAQLYGMACRLSHALCRLDLPPGPIGIRLPYNATHWIALLGCLGAARPSLLMSRDHPLDYSQRLAEAAGVAAILVSAQDALDGLLLDGLRVIAIDSLLVPSGVSDEHPAARLEADETAFILSTSGTTGAPKLIPRWQRRIQASAHENIPDLKLSENDRCLLVGGPTSGIAVRGLAYLMVGVTMHLIDARHAGLGGILRAIRDGRVTYFASMVSTMKAMAQLENAKAYLGSLRAVKLGGEMLLQKDLAQFRAVLSPDCRVSYALSMTEATVAKWFVPEKDDHDPVRVAVGYLRRGTEVLIVDDDGRPCPPGQIGELIVRGESVAPGEWRDGKLVQGRFQTDSTTATKRIYRTGDLVRMFPDGVIVVCGRKDRMIKIRGHRVEPAVIETSMCSISGVKTATVLAKPVADSYRLYGFVVPHEQADRASLPAKVREELKNVLPIYMQPYDIHVIDALPLSMGGKIDNAALLQRVSAAEAESAVTAAISQARASRQARIWMADAWRAAFRADMNPALGFDAAGGDSLRLMQIIFRLEQLSGRSLPLDCFEYGMSQDDMALALDHLLDGGQTLVQDTLGGIGTRSGNKQVFLIPGVGGDEPRLVQFRAGCASDVSLTCLHYGNWSEWVDRDFILDRLIEQMVVRIQELAPTGTLSLAGYSLGGRIALAAAAKLQATGREIERVLILDSSAVVPIDPEDAEAAVLAPPMSLREEYWEWRRARGWRAKAFATALVVARRLVQPRWSLLLRWIARHRRIVLPGQVDFYLSFYIHRLWLMKLSSEWLHRLVKIPQVSAPITIFRVQEAGAHSNRDAAAWERHSPRVTMVPVGGDHYTMFDPPHLADLCAQFTAACTAAAGSEAELHHIAPRI